MYYIYNIPLHIISDIISYAKDSNDINLHGHVSLYKEAGKAIGQGMHTIGSNIGLGASMAGVARAVGKTIAKSYVPPIQKAGIVVGASMIVGLFHSKRTLTETKFCLNIYKIMLFLTVTLIVILIILI